MAHRGDRDELRDLVRGRLPEGEAAALAARIAADRQFAAEHRLVAALAEADPAGSPFPGDFGWGRLSWAIQRLERPPLWRRRIAVWQVAAAAALCVAAHQTTMILAPWIFGRGGDARYVVATGDAGGTAAGAPNAPLMRDEIRPPPRGDK